MKKLLLIIFFTMFPVLAHGGTYYVAKTGSDSNSCNSAQSQSTPKLTINAGIGCLSAGDTLIVKPGTYVEVLGDIIPSGTAGNPTIVRSETQYGAIIQPGPGNQGNLWGTVGIIGFSGRSYITIDGFILDGTGLGPVYHVYLGGPPNFSPSDHITITHCEIRFGTDVNSTSNVFGIYLGENSHDLLISHNKIHDLGTGAGPGQAFYSYGSYWHASYTIFEDNEVYNCSGFGLHMYTNPTQGQPTVDNNIVRNNILHDNGYSAIIALTGANNLFYNNIMYRNGLLGPGSNGPEAMQVGGFGGLSSKNSIYNNTFYANVGVCLQLGIPGYGSSDNNIARNNICWQNGSDAVTVGNGSGNTIDHNLSGRDPLFVNAAAADFHLRAGSPATDAGVMIPGLSFNGSAPDLGAVESGTGGQFPAPTNLRLVVN